MVNYGPQNIMYSDNDYKQLHNIKQMVIANLKTLMRSQFALSATQNIFSSPHSVLPEWSPGNVNLAKAWFI